MTIPRTAGLSHVVLIRLDPSAPAGSGAALERDLRILVDRHPLVRRGLVAADLGLRPGSDRSATWLAVMDFDQPDAFAAYLASPDHRDFLTRHRGAIAALLAAQVDPFRDPSERNAP